MNKYREAFRERLEMLGLLRSAGALPLGVLTALQTVGALLPALGAVLTGLMIRRITDIAAHPGGSTAGRLLPVLVGPALLIVVGQAAEALGPSASFLAARRIDGRLRASMRALALAGPGIERLERQDVQDDLRRAADRGGWRDRTPGTGAVGLLKVAFQLAGAVLAAAVLAQASPALAALALAAALLVRHLVSRVWFRIEDTIDGFAGERRRAEYWAGLATRAPAAKEVRIFGIAPWIVGRQLGHSMAWLGPLWRLRAVTRRRQWAAFAILAAVTLGGLGLLVRQAATGRIAVADFAKDATALLAVFAIARPGFEAYDIEHGRVALRAMRRLRAEGVSDTGPETDAVPPTEPRQPKPPAIRLEGVRFAYPGTTRPVLAGLDLDIRPGEVLAVVGTNGAGKTTLMKLLSGLYRPDSGRILVDGADTAETGVARWQRRVTVIFQDFVRYELSARANVELGRGGLPLESEALAGIAAASGADRIVAGLPAGWDTVLSRGQDGGVDLSGGQWQKIAIARALAGASGGGLLVLDEPTANLDVRAELDFFDRVVGNARDMTVVLVSHRLATVRRADRIVVVRDGVVAECGSHEALMDADGEYARMYRLQSEQFADHAEEAVAS